MASESLEPPRMPWGTGADSKARLAVQAGGPDVEGHSYVTCRALEQA